MWLFSHRYIPHTNAHPGPDPSHEAALFGRNVQQKGGVGGGQHYSSCVSPWKQAGEQHIPLDVLSETEDESSPH